MIFKKQEQLTRTQEYLRSVMMLEEQMKLLDLEKELEALMDKITVTKKNIYLLYNKASILEY